MPKILDNSAGGEMLRHLFPNEFLKAAAGKCPCCGAAINTDEFRDELSRKEFKISGMCQKCQDAFFGEDG